MVLDDCSPHHHGELAVHHAFARRALRETQRDLALAQARLQMTKPEYAEHIRERITDLDRQQRLALVGLETSDPQFAAMIAEQLGRSRSRYGSAV